MDYAVVWQHTVSSLEIELELDSGISSLMMVIDRNM